MLHCTTHTQKHDFCIGHAIKPINQSDSALENSSEFKCFCANFTRPIFACACVGSGNETYIVCTARTAFASLRLSWMCTGIILLEISKRHVCSNVTSTTMYMNLHTCIMYMSVSWLGTSNKCTCPCTSCYC